MKFSILNQTVLSCYAKSQTKIMPGTTTVQSSRLFHMEEKVYYRRKFTTGEQLKLAIIQEWRDLGQRFIDTSINEWRQRLQIQQVVEKQSGHIEHVF